MYITKCIISWLELSHTDPSNYKLPSCMYKHYIMFYLPTIDLILYDNNFRPNVVSAAWPVRSEMLWVIYRNILNGLCAASHHHTLTDAVHSYERSSVHGLKLTWFGPFPHISYIVWSAPELLQSPISNIFCSDVFQFSTSSANYIEYIYCCLFYPSTILL